MAEATNPQTGPVPVPTSVILAMHWRYEKAHEEMGRIEKIESTTPKDESDKRDIPYWCQNGTRALLVECAAIRAAILRQVPDTWDEARVMLFHIVGSHDMNAASDFPDSTEVDDVTVGLEHLFDFMCCENSKNSADYGAAFHAESERVFKLRRNRTGRLED